MSYLKNSEVSFRIGLNPFNWKWLPKATYEGPTPFYPKRCTYAFVWLFLQAFFDLDDGTTDIESFNKAFLNAMDVFDEPEDVGSKIPRNDKINSELE